ncbi:MarR family winged helix-turn-helix transcriptional regulator [Streptacidiphilus sp. P02-A3a]|uniref:MarR family winged helix-turn-helix transcriptional regulator n=1 Tax=Streptacidiphilus sp. P02-A3a TaxID=2704468 RepID=UPI0015F8A865|nr:MarR family transcriptional regulator [Streptacidiphilus sp. P02-A3a]QMU73180.1 MarR family transcriptional regulator [Streptacidiphilus sp. P02-A3a]
MTEHPPTPLAQASELDISEQVAAYQREFPTVDPQVETIVSTMSRLARRMSVAYGRQLADLGIGSADWEVLKTLIVAGSPYRLGPGELAKRLGLTPAAMTHRIDRMAAAGLVTRSRDESNRVRVIIELTRLGREKWLESMRMAAVFEEDLLQDASTEERAVLAGHLGRMLRRVEEHQPDALGRCDDLD